MNWTDLPQATAERQALADTVMNLKFHKMWNVSWLAEKLLVCQELQSMDLMML
jgi:hypothetical protein